VALLRRLGVTATPATTPRQDLAERLAQSLDLNGAVRLHAALQPAPASGPAARGQTQAQTQGLARALERELDRLRTSLAAAVAAGAARAADLSGERADAGPAAGGGAWRQQHSLLQHQMETRIAALRENARQALRQASPRLRRLADLDATLEAVLADTERRALAGAPALLARQLAGAGPPDGGMEGADAWCAALRAEIETRLAPVSGLWEALRGERGSWT
jgi:hypothetical protein